MPHAIYDLAYIDNNVPCVISPNFIIPKGVELIHGNQLIEGFDKNLIFKNTKHTLDEILKALRKNKVMPIWRTPDQHQVFTDATGLFIGYLCFDSWIANTDRHAENWGIVTTTENINILAPTFDHASSLGRNESDENRVERLRTKDMGYNVRAYVRRAVTPIYDDNGKALNVIEVAQKCKRIMPRETKYWLNKIGNIMHDDNKVANIFKWMPDEFISQPGREFALAILNETAKQLMELLND